MEQRNYSVSEIARICESNDVSILNLSVNTIDANGLQAVTIKVNAQDIQALQATFERYGYVHYRGVCSEQPQ
jgi:acetoin utilization protein AcuB